MSQPKTKLIIALLLAAAIGLTSWAAYSNFSGEDPQPKDAATSAKTTPAQVGRTEINYQARPGITSLEQLKDEAADVITETSEYGELVTSIEGHTGGTDSKYWSFYVNGEMAQVGAGSYIQEEGDQILWKFQSL